MKGIFMSGVNNNSQIIRFGQKQIDTSKSDGVKKNTVVKNDQQNKSIMDALWQKFDTNNDGYLDTKEITDMYRVLNKAAANGVIGEEQVTQIASNLNLENIQSSDLQTFAQLIADDNDNVTAKREGKTYTVVDGNTTTIQEYSDDAHTKLSKQIVKNGNSTVTTSYNDSGKATTEETIIKNKYENLIFYESPNRLQDTLSVIAKVDPDKTVTVGRELTKKFEEIKKDNIKNIIEYYKTHTLKGEIAVLLHKSETKEEIDIKDKIKKLQKLNLKDKEISSIISALFEVNKNDVYKMCIEIKK